MKYVKVKRCLFLILLVLFSAFFIINCHGKKVEENLSDYKLNNPEKKNNIILKIEDSFYFNSNFEKHLLLIAGNEYNNLSLDSLSRLFDNFVEEKILLEAARSKKIALTWEEQKTYLAKLAKESWPYEKKLALNQIDTKVILERLLIEKYTFEIVKDIEVTDEETKEYYDLHKREFLRPERVKVSQILLKTEDKAIEVLERLKGCDDEDFRKAVKEISIGVEASKGGEMGVFEMGQLPFEMEKVIFSLEEGELSPVVESSYGYHIFKLDKRYEPGLISEEEAASEIKIKILNVKIKQKISQNLKELKEKIGWDFYLENLSFPYQRNNRE